MKKVFLSSLMFLLVFLFLSAGGWLPTSTRLDTGDSPGMNVSIRPQISRSDSNVYVVWMDDRNGSRDIYLNYSTDGGKTWKTPDERIDTGDSPGANGSSLPQINAVENNIFVVWQDYRNGDPDIYFNTASIPIPDIKANGSDGPVTISRSDALSITVEIEAGTFAGDRVDWWLVAQTPLGWYHYNPNSGWLPGREVTLQIPLRDLPSREVFNMSGLPPGNYTFYFGVDLNENGKINKYQAYYDSVKVTVNP